MALQYQGLLVMKDNEPWEFKIFADGNWTLTDTPNSGFFRTLTPSDEARRSLEQLKEKNEIYLSPIETIYKGAFQDSDKSVIFSFSIDSLGRLKIKQSGPNDKSEFYVNSSLDVKKKAFQTLENLKAVFDVTLS